jgi:formylglycine-generating enzyme required for sulfatase activity
MSTLTTPAQITTFYSYKGGTGRTMLLANVAWILASAGKRVLAIDWDLEAPGLHHYFHPFLIDPHLEATEGLIDMVAEYSREAITPEDKTNGANWLDRATDVSRFVASVNWKFPRGGLLHLLPAGRQNPSFSVRVNTFHWTDFYERLNGGAFLELVKKRIRRDYGYDHILIDSRTGVSDTSGICTVQMPDRLIACFTASEQSIQGCATVASSVWAQWARLKSTARDDEKFPTPKRHIFPILMRIEPSEKTKLDAARAYVRQLFGALPGLSENDEDYWSKAEVGYWPFYAFEEVLAVFGDRFRTDSSLLAACEHVTSLITDGNVNRLPALESAQREQVLAAYERHTKRQDGEAAVHAVHARDGGQDTSWTGRPTPVERDLRWFLSYNSLDQALAERLKVAIERKDPSSSVFFAPRSLGVSGFWSAQLAQQISNVGAFILLVGEGGLSNRQIVEYDEALDRRVKSPDFPLVVVLLEGQMLPGLPFLRLLPLVVSSESELDKNVTRVLSATAYGAPEGERWRHTAPYRGLAAMTEADSEFFFGRERETVEVIKSLADKPERLPLLLGNSGVGKSSLAQAGVLAALMRQRWPETAEAAGAWPHAIGDSRHWCFLTFRPGTEPLRGLVEAFLRLWQFDVIDPGRVARAHEWTDRFINGYVKLGDLIDTTERRLEELGQSRPSGFLLYVDQGEELYVRADDRHRRRFSEILADGLHDPRLRAMMSMRSDFLGELQSDEPLFAVHTQINVPPLREAELREVVSRPAQLLSVRFESEQLAVDIARRAAEDVGALPLLSYLLDDIWSQMVQRGDGVLRLSAQLIEIGDVLVQRMGTFLRINPGSEQALRRIFTLKLATIREGGEPTRRRASRSEFSNEEWRLVTELAGHPNRLLITATPDGGETYVEVAGEAIFRRWERLREWIAAEREFLVWRSSLEVARRSWQATSSADDALLMGLPLARARSWVTTRADDLPADDREFIGLSIAREKRAQRRARGVQALIYVMLFGIIGGLVSWINQNYITEQFRWVFVTLPYASSQVKPYVLTGETERSLRPGDSFRECARACSEMIVIPAGTFMMGSSAREPGRLDNEAPQHQVTIVRPFAISKYELTFEDWDTCAGFGDCDPEISDSGWGRGSHPVINLTWEDAQRYVHWLSRLTGKPYRLLSEAEYEYAARAGTSTAYPWGNDIGTNRANCQACGSKWDNMQPAPVGSFAPNAFGLYDMVGNVSEWVEDCYHTNYVGAPADGSAWVSDCRRRVIRGGSWSNNPQNLRVASRTGSTTDLRVSTLGFRIARTLAR